MLTTKLTRRKVAGVVLSLPLMLLLAVVTVHAYAYHDSVVVKQYAMKNSNIPSKYSLSMTGKIANLKGVRSSEPATIDIIVHKWNQHKPGAIYSAKEGMVRAGPQEYKIDYGC